MGAAENRATYSAPICRTDSPMRVQPSPWDNLRLKGASALLLATLAAVVVVLVLNEGEAQQTIVAESARDSEGLGEVEMLLQVQEAAEKMSLKAVMLKLQKAKKREKMLRKAKKDARKLRKKTKKVKKQLIKSRKAVKKAAAKRLTKHIASAVELARKRANRRAVRRHMTKASQRLLRWKYMMDAKNQVIVRHLQAAKARALRHAKQQVANCAIRLKQLKLVVANANKRAAAAAAEETASKKALDAAAPAAKAVALQAWKKVLRERDASARTAHRANSKQRRTVIRCNHIKAHQAHVQNLVKKAALRIAHNKARIAARYARKKKRTIAANKRDAVKIKKAKALVAFRNKLLKDAIIRKLNRVVRRCTRRVARAQKRVVSAKARVGKLHAKVGKASAAAKAAAAAVRTLRRTMSAAKHAGMAAKGAKAKALAGMKLAKAAGQLTKAIKKNTKLRNKDLRAHRRYEHSKTVVGIRKRRVRLAKRKLRRAQRAVSLKKMEFKLSTHLHLRGVHAASGLPKAHKARRHKRRGGFPKRKPLHFKKGKKAPTAALAEKATQSRYKQEALAGHFLHGADAIASIKGEDFYPMAFTENPFSAEEEFVEQDVAGSDDAQQYATQLLEEHLNWQGRQPKSRNGLQ